MMHISIPTPCHEDWNAMTPNQQGRHCNACAKTVVDFTGMSDEEVQYFFINKKKEENVCGRFKNDQLRRIKVELPYNIYTMTMPLWKQFLTACLLAFSSMLFSCDTLVGNNNTLGETIPFVMRDDTAKANLPLPPPPPSIFRVTGFTMVIADSTIPAPVCTKLMGDIQVVEPLVTQGFTIIKPVQDTAETEVLLPPLPTEQPDTSQAMPVGKVRFDTKTIDASETKKDSLDCDNDFIKL